MQEKIRRWENSTGKEEAEVATAANVVIATIARIGEDEIELIRTLVSTSKSNLLYLFPFDLIYRVYRNNNQKSGGDGQKRQGGNEKQLKVEKRD